jgi:hypothetical protein
MDGISVHALEAISVHGVDGATAADDLTAVRTRVDLLEDNLDATAHERVVRPPLPARPAAYARELSHP